MLNLSTHRTKPAMVTLFFPKFYEENSTLSLQMWQWLSKFESAPVYIKYLQTLK